MPRILSFLVLIAILLIPFLPISVRLINFKVLVSFCVVVLSMEGSFLLLLSLLLLEECDGVGEGVRVGEVVASSAPVRLTV